MNMVKTEYVYDKNQNQVGRIEDEYGFGVVAHRFRDKATFTFLTHGHRTVVGPSEDWSGTHINSIKGLARAFIRS